MELFTWIARELQPHLCTSEAFIYDDMASQSGRSLPLVYQPFDVGERSHWRDRGAVSDFILSTQGQGKHLLDLGPGDGWPSLIVAPFVDEVVGVEGSHRRVEVCRENAARMGIDNARFLYVEPGAPLPFEAASFDGAMAASSIEQTPDPRITLGELWRVLRPGGRLRVHYEALNRYRDGQERDLWLWEMAEDRCRLVLFDRNIDQEWVVQYGLTFAMSGSNLAQAFGAKRDTLRFEALSLPALKALRPALLDARACRTVHPSGATLAAWMGQAGFREVLPTHDGIEFAGRLFDRLAPADRPGTMEALDAYLRPLVKIIIELPAPIESDPMITAIK